MYKKDFNERPIRSEKREPREQRGPRADGQQKVKRPKRNFDLPSFVNSDGVVITQCIGVKVPPADSDRPDAKKFVLELALRHFKRKVKESGILDEYKNRTEYIKPSVIKRRQKLEAIRRESRGYSLPE